MSTTPRVTLPRPPERFSPQEESQNRRAIEAAFAEVKARLDNLEAANATALSAYLPLAGGVMTGNLTVGGAQFLKSTTWPGLGLTLPAAASIANNGTLELHDTNFAGVLLIILDTGQAALVACNGHSTSVLAIRGSWTTVSGTASSLNVFWNAGTSRYRFENKSGFAVTPRIWQLGDMTGM